MSDLDRLSNALKKAHERAQAGDEQAAQHARAIAGEIRRLQASGPAQDPDRPSGAVRPFALLNQGLANIPDAIGGLANRGINVGLEAAGIDYRLDERPGSRLMDEAGIQRAQGENALEQFVVGTGEAAGAAVPVAGVLRAAGQLPGLFGRVAQSADASLRTATGVGTEVAMGGVSRAAERMAADEGLPEWAQTTAAVGAPLGVAGAVSGVGAAGRAASRYTPVGRGVAAVQRAITPYTESGARAVARQRVQDLAGGPERADALASQIGGENPLRLTPAQQTGDPNMLALEQTAAAQSPVFRERLERGIRESSDAAQREFRAMGGDPEAAQAFFQQRRTEFTSDLRRQADQAVADARAQIESIQGTRPDGENSLIVSRAVNQARDAARLRENELWDAIPRGVQVGTSNVKRVAQEFIDSTPFAQQQDIPRELRAVLDTPDVYGEAATVNDMHGLYSRLREISRTAMSGNNQQRNLARIADQAAEAVLRDMGAVDGTTAIGAQINEARAYSRAMHEVFDQGAVGRLSRRTLDGDLSTDPELALQRTVGRQGTEAAVASRQLEAGAQGPVDPATGRTVAQGQEAVRDAAQDYLAGQFALRTGASGEFSTASARRFQANNRELLARFPQLRDDIDAAVRQGLTAEQAAQRVTQRIGALMDQRQAAGAAFLGQQPEQAIQGILSARNPQSAAARLANEARKDPTGAALDGLKGAFVNHIVAKSLRAQDGQFIMSGDSAMSALNDPAFRRALGPVFTGAERRRLDTLINQLTRLDAAQRAAPDIGPTLSGARAPRALDMVARVIAARAGAQYGGNMAGGLQAAQMASSRMKDLVQRLTADRASLLIADAVQDPQMFRALLTETGSLPREERIYSRIFPYLLGSAATAIADEE